MSLLPLVFHLELQPVSRPEPTADDNSLKWREHGFRKLLWRLNITHTQTELSSPALVSSSSEAARVLTA